MSLHDILLTWGRRGDRAMRSSLRFSHETPYSESDEEFNTRVQKFLELLEEQRKIHNEIYVITHGLFMCHLTNTRSVQNCQRMLFLLKND